MMGYDLILINDIPENISWGRVMGDLLRKDFSDNKKKLEEESFSSLLEITSRAQGEVSLTHGRQQNRT